MTPDRVAFLYQRYLQNQLNPLEQKEFEDILNSHDLLKLEELIDKDWDYLTDEKLLDLTTAKKDKVFEHVVHQSQLNQLRVKRLWPRLAAAASIILMLSFGAYYLLSKQPSQQISKIQAHDILPGGNKAILTLSNGQNISLTDAQNGNIAKQSGTQIQKAHNGQIIYTANNIAPNLSSTINDPKNIAYNTISTPRGGQWQLTLSDGTRIWLNAASSITFPTAFTGANRTVKITGEVYFEVVHNPASPFRVITKGQTIEDVGTHFNVNAYDDEGSVKTTLLEGSVDVSHNNNEHKLLVPGEQAMLKSNSLIVSKANTEEAVAWKNGYFRFDSEPLPLILRQFSRWYDITIVDNDQMNGQYFNVKISRSAQLSRVLKILELGGIHYKVEGRKLIIEP